LVIAMPLKCLQFDKGISQYLRFLIPFASALHLRARKGAAPQHNECNNNEQR